MSDREPLWAMKTHPATREVLPDDPLELQGHELPGDTRLMLRILVEEYARVGFGLEDLLILSRQPFYQGLHGLWRLYGEEELRTRLSEILSRCGVFRAVTRETQPRSEQLVQLDMSRVVGEAPDHVERAGHEQRE